MRLADLRGMALPALEAEINRRANARNQAQAELAKLASQRDTYLKSNAKGGDGFDAKVKDALDAQLK